MRCAASFVSALLLFCLSAASAKAGEPCGGPVSFSDFSGANWSVLHNDFRPPDYQENALEWANMEIPVGSGTPPEVNHTVGTMLSGVGQIGSLQIFPLANNTGAHIQTRNPYLSVLDGKGDFVFVARFKIDALDGENAFFVGLSTPGIGPVLDSDGILGSAQRIGFYHAVDDGMSLDVTTRDKSGVVTTDPDALTLTHDDALFDIAIVSEGQSLSFWARDTRAQPSDAFPAWQQVAIRGSFDWSFVLNASFAFVWGDSGSGALWIDSLCWSFRRSP